MSQLEVYPFTKLSWRSRKIQREWQPIMRELSQAVYFTEYEMVKRGHRDADVYQLDPNRFDVQIKKVFDDKLSYQPILRSKKYSGFGHRHYLKNQIDMDTFIYGVVAKDYETAIKFREASLGNIDHKAIGQMLGYPDCCTDWFLKVWLKEGCVDPMYETALQTSNHKILKEGEVEVHGHPYLNRLIRYFNFTIIPFFACSYECEEAIKFSETWFKLMKEKAPTACEKLLEVLDMPCTWSLNNLIIYVDHPLFRGAANGYQFPKKRVVHWKP